MAVKDILIEIDLEIARLQQAKALLSGTTVSSGKVAKADKAVKTTTKKKKKRNLSPEGRRRIAEAVKRRWAAQRKAAA